MIKLSTRLRKFITDTVLSLLVLILFGTGAFSYFNYMLQDALFQRPGLLHPDIIVIGIDERAIEIFGHPAQWSRDIMASAVEILNSDQEFRPAVIALDVLYVGESALPEADERLANAAQDGGNIVTAARAIVRNVRASNDNSMAARGIVGFERPYAALAKHATYGLVNAVEDSDGRIRKTAFAHEHEGEVLYSFAFEIYRKFTGAEETEPWVYNLEKMILFHGPPGTYKMFSFADIFDPYFEPDILDGAIVMIGAFTPGLMDDFYVPGHTDRMNGVEIHANILQTLLDGNLLQYAPGAVNWAIIILFTVLALVLANKLEIRLLLLAFAGVIVAYGGVSLLVFYNGYILTLLYPLLIPVLVYIYQLTYSYVVQKIEAQKLRVVAERHQILADSLNYASVVQRGILPKDAVFTHAFADHSVIWEPRDTVGGDIYWIKTFEQGSLLAVCDCTGHGVPGALLTALVVSSFEDIVDEETCTDPGNIIYMLDQKLVRIFESEAIEKQDKQELYIKNGCDLAVLFVSNNGEVSIASGNFNVFICDGSEITRVKGQRLKIGEGKLKAKEDVKVKTIPFNENNKFYISSDGMYDQIGGVNGHSFGYSAFKQVILENHELELNSITEKVWDVFENYRGSQLRRDDFELVSFKP